MRASHMVIDLNKFNNNIDKIKKYVGGKTLIPVIKANGYGTYINTRLDVIDKFDIVAVAIVKEAVELRNIGYYKEILVINQPCSLDIEDIIKYDITIGVSDLDFIKKIIDTKEKIKVHLEIETGMNRTGIKLQDLDSIVNLIKDSNLIVEGVYTHLSSADSDEEYTLKQLDTFKDGVAIVSDNFDTLKYIHSGASNGLLKYDDGISNACRPGLVMYGYETFDNMYSFIDVEPIATLKSMITFLKEVDIDESISYSRRFITKRKSKIATIPIGYADGIRRSLTNNGYVVVNNKKAPIVGTVCMDSFMIDVTDIDCKVGDEVYIWDNDNITLDEVAKECNTINYEILCTISNRVPRIFK